MPLLVMFWVLLIAIFFRNSVYRFLTRNFAKVFKIGDLEVDEGLDNYFNTLDEHDRNWSIKEEDNARSALKLKILTDETYDRLKKTTLGKQHMEGVHTYDILANSLYLDDFQYFTPSMLDREKFIIDDDDDEENDNAQSDLVKMILNLAFMTKERAEKFTFSKDTYSSAVKGSPNSASKQSSNTAK